MHRSEIKRGVEHQRAVRGGGTCALLRSNPGEEIGNVYSGDARTLANQLRERYLPDREQALEHVFENMAHAVCLFDAQGTLVTCNRRYSELYALSESMARSGTSFESLHQHLVTAGLIDVDPTAYLQARMSQTEIVSRDIHFEDGRTIALHLSPLPEGGWVSTATDVTEKRRMVRELAELATKDHLTGLANRASFIDQLGVLVAKSSSAHPVALHLIDLDRFKGVNDIFGHLVGDEVLSQVAGRLRSLLRKRGLVARLGGDEFAIIHCPTSSAAQVDALAGRVVAALARPFQVGGKIVTIGATVGTAIAPHDAKDEAQLLRRSDLALYAAKANGRGRYTPFDESMEAAARLKSERMRELRLALERNEFRLFYQPILDLARNVISGFEALIRWQHPSKGLLQPDDFISLAEESGLIVQVGTWALHAACAQAAHWPPELKLAVNLSPTQCVDGLVEAVTGALQASGLAATRLDLEVTETVLLLDRPEVCEALNRLRSLGIGIVMDDFGTGFSSLSYLLSYPFSKIKIDRSFVASCDTSKGRAIVHAAIVLADGLGIATTAEGVETQEQLDFLRWEGCTEAQGYLIHPPAHVSAMDVNLTDFLIVPTQILANQASGFVERQVRVEHRLSAATDGDG